MTARDFWTRRSTGRLNVSPSKDRNKSNKRVLSDVSNTTNQDNGHVRKRRRTPSSCRTPGLALPGSAVTSSPSTPVAEIMPQMSLSFTETPCPSQRGRTTEATEQTTEHTPPRPPPRRSKRTTPVEEEAVPCPSQRGRTTEATVQTTEHTPRPPPRRSKRRR